uniref:Uncharacterized protein n=1 Tax=Aegilops tauschii subsp. strangulata TaxID=200361 RepID=A0A452Z3V7_AEGTS
PCSLACCCQRRTAACYRGQGGELLCSALLRPGRMREEEEPSWFARFDEDLPAPDELMPLSQSLITRDLAAAFDIPTH